MSSSFVKPTSLASALPSLEAFQLQLPQVDGKTLASTALVLVVTLLVAEQSYWRWRKGSLPGLTYQVPVIGQFAESLNPTMEAYKRSWARPLSAISVFNIFIVMASTTEYARKILNASSATEPCLVRSAKQILLPENWVFLNGKVHNEFRKGLNCLFTTQALSIYLRIQDMYYRKHFKLWLEAEDRDEYKPFQMLFRDMNMETSLRVFCGEYIHDSDVREVSDNYWKITKALELVNFPFAFPGTKVWHACRTRAATVKYLEMCAHESKKKMAAGGEPNCLLDEWVQEILASKAYEEGKTEGAERPALLLREYSDREMALVLLSFIFASQDAMSSSLTFGFQLLADYPDVMAKVREEQARVRGDDAESAVTLELLEQMPYTTAVVKEGLRYRPPVIMVPYLTKKPFAVNDQYTVPKGTMLIPSFWNSLHDGDVYPDPDEFKPERWLPGGANEAGTDSKNWLVFGAGAHRCIAQNYVIMNMTATLGTAAHLLDWDHKKTPESDDIKIIATLFPKDGCWLKFRARDQK